MPNLTSKDWVRMLISFLLGVAVTLLVIQLTGGQLFQGYLTQTYIAPTSTRTLETTDTSLSTSLERLSTGEKTDSAKDDTSGLIDVEFERADELGGFGGEDLDLDEDVDLEDFVEFQSGWLESPTITTSESDDTLSVIDDDN